MFQRLSNLLFGAVENVSAELNGPKPCVTEVDDEGWLLVSVPEGAPAEASPMEDLLIEHPSMSVYVSSSNLEQSAASMAESVGRMTESTPAPVSTRPVRGSACQAVPLAKVTQVNRVQRAKARVDRRHLARGRIQRQNRTRQQIPRHVAYTRNSFLHQPCHRSICH